MNSESRILNFARFTIQYSAFEF